LVNYSDTNQEFFDLRKITKQINVNTPYSRVLRNFLQKFTEKIIRSRVWLNRSYKYFFHDSHIRSFWSGQVGRRLSTRVKAQCRSGARETYEGESARATICGIPRAGQSTSRMTDPVKTPKPKPKNSSSIHQSIRSIVRKWCIIFLYNYYLSATFFFIFCMKAVV